jgi:alpha-1,2-rhamnosyltransferase
MSYEVRRILLECTQIHQSRGTTGIPRVVRSLAEFGPEAALASDVELVPVVVSGERFYRVSLAPPGSETLPTMATRTRRSFERWFGPKCGGRLGAVLQQAVARLEKWLYPRSLIRAATNFRLRRSAAEIQVRPTDLLVLTGSRWSSPVHVATATAARAGVPIGVIIYDLIPVDHPEFFKRDHVAIFHEWIDNVAAVADVFLSISRTTRDRLWRYVQQRFAHRRMGPRQFSWFALGATIDSRAAPRRLCPGLERAFAGGLGSTYLTVSTIEPRKNQAFLLDAFEEVWQTHPDARLCIVGRIGWLCGDLIERISTHPRFGRQLHMFSDLSDGELDYCYRHARAFLFASKDEGYGLPIVEALSHRLPVLASDIPIHREVGGDFCAYFDLAKPGALAEMVRRLERCGALPGVAPAEEYRPVNWPESSRDFVRQTLQAAAALPDCEAPRRAAA